ncbi:MAG: transketolase, partial [Desulfovibrio sp.]|nr:transketolase [Desulfovibrio sp.]
PTHQPVEQLPALRMIPKLRVWRPCDGLETACAWADAIKRKGSTCLILSRQSLPKYPRVETELAEQTAMIHRGGYILRDCSGEPHLIILATGSELELAVGCYEKLTKMGEQVRVVSLPCTDLFDAQDEAWKEMVLPNKVRNRLAIEAAAPVYLYKYVGLDGKVLGLTSFGVSAKAKDCAAHFGFTLENVLNSALDLLKKPKNCLGS